MGARCRCGVEVRYAFHLFGCLECGSACCAVCAVSLESVHYCPRCAGRLLGVSAVRSAARADLL